MGKDDEQLKNQQVNSNPFTINSEKTKEMPSLNLLLNRKKLELNQNVAPSPPPEKIQIEKSKFEIEINLRPGDNPLEIESTSTPFKAKNEDTKSNPRIQKSQRKNSVKPAENLVLWDLLSLKNSTDSLGKALSYLFEKGASSGLFLAITPPPQGSSVPLFLSTAAIEPQDRLNLWTGLQWDPRILPEVWNFFLKIGIVEFAPPGTMTNIMSNRNVIRGAFGVSQEEWLSLLRVGEINACRGVVALISKTSLQLPLRQALRMMNAEPAKKAS